MVADFRSLSTVLFGIHVLLAACDGGSSTALPTNAPADRIRTIAYTNTPITPGDFEPFQVVLDLETSSYTVPARDGYGTFRFDETKICFFASYSDQERCIDFLFPPSDWSVGESWDMASYDGRPIRTTVDVIE